VPERRGIVALDDTGWPKQGTHSVGVKRPYCGALGKIANCHVAVSSALIGTHHACPLTCELSLPQEWLDDPVGRGRAEIPARVPFREKWPVALVHVRALLKAGFDVTAVVADADGGRVASFRRRLERLGLRYAVAVRAEPAMSRTGARRTRSVADLARQVPARDWRRIC
jgi:SRSO17 transposase